MSTEAAANFWSSFQKEREALLDALANSPNVSQPSLPVHFDSILDRINTLNKQLTDATIFLPTYDEQQLSSQLKFLTDELANQRATLLPRTKFSFKSRKTATASKPEVIAANIPVNSESDQILTLPAQPGTSANLSTYAFTNENERFLTLRSSEGKGNGDCSLSNLNRCVIDLRDSGAVLSAIHVNGLNECVVISPPIAGSILIYACKKCVFVIACHQFRMHTSTNISLYLHATSNPIIESCSSVRVAPYPFTNPTLFEAVNLPKEPNYFADIQDFSWLRKQTSPNWNIIPEEERRVEWDIVAGDGDWIGGFIEKWIS